MKALAVLTARPWDLSTPAPEAWGNPVPQSPQRGQLPSPLSETSHCPSTPPPEPHLLDPAQAPAHFDPSWKSLAPLPHPTTYDIHHCSPSMTPKICAYGGLVLTQVPPETPFLGRRFTWKAQNLSLRPPALLKVTVVAADILNVPTPLKRPL